MMLHGSLPSPRVAPVGSLLVVLLATLLAGGPAEAQQRIAVFSEPGTPVIATEVLIAAGPADEDSASAGLAYLAARSVTEPLRPLLDSLDAHLVVGAQKDALTFTLTAAPDAWEEVTRALLVALFRDPPDSLAMVREQRAIAAELRGRQANPADALLREIDAAFFGEDHPWGRPTVGTPRTVQRLGRADVDRFLRSHFKPERAVVAVVGPVEPQAARAVLQPFLTASGPVPFEPEARRPADSPVRRDYNSITTWVSTSFPLPAGADEEALRLAAYLVREELSTGPGSHLVFNVRSELISRLQGGELRFQVVIPPGEAGKWADRIRRALERYSDVLMLRAEWEAKLRRYQGERLQELSAPEDRAHVAARRLLLSGRAEQVVPDLEGLSLARVRAAVHELGEPVVVFLGPDFDDD